MKAFVVTVVHTESTHYRVEAENQDDAIERARDLWASDDSEHVVSLGSEFAEIDKIYIDEAGEV